MKSINAEVGMTRSLRVQTGGGTKAQVWTHTPKLSFVFIPRVLTPWSFSDDTQSHNP